MDYPQILLQSHCKAGVGRWLSRDPLGEEAFLRLQSQGKPEEVIKKLRHQANLPSYVFLGNHPLASIDPSGLTTWRGKCETYNWSLGLGLLFVHCYLDSFHEIGADKHAEWVAVKAVLLLACPLGFPVGYTSSQNVFKSPPGTDHTVFKGTATLLSSSVAVGKGWYITASNLGQAELDSVTGEQGGFDFGVSGALGRFWVKDWRVLGPDE